MSRMLLGEIPKLASGGDKGVDLVTYILEAFSMMTIADPDAIILIAERSIMIPTLILLLQRAGMVVLGLNTNLDSCAA